MMPFKRGLVFVSYLIITFILLISLGLPICNACSCTADGSITSIGMGNRTDNSSPISMGLKDQMNKESEYAVDPNLAKNNENASINYKNSSMQMPDSIGNAAKNATHTIMHPNHEDANRWLKGYKAAPRAYLSPRVALELTQVKGEHFSLLDYLNYMPSERNQGKCGNCWAWAGTGVMEIDNAYQNGAKDRLSVQYLTSNFNDGKGNNWACCGGWLEDLSDFYNSEMLSVPWSNTNALWKDGSRSCEDGSTSVPSNAISTQPHYNLSSAEVESVPTQGVGKEIAISNIKNVLRQGKAIWFGFFLPDNNAWNNYFTFWDLQKESSVWKPDLACGKSYNDHEGGGHAVLCVGYDDTDPNNRYWIMLNSWGAPSNRPNGLFLMSMDMNYDCSYLGLGNAFYWMTLNISYANAPPAVPSIPAGPGLGSKKMVYTYTTSAVDPNGDRIKYTFDWGDGTTFVTDYVSSGSSISASHSWDKLGNYLIKVKAIDSKGASSEWSKLQAIKVSKKDSPPFQPRKPIGPSRGLKGVSYTYSAISKDPDGDKLQYLFEWGDGTKSDMGPIASGRSIIAGHSWSGAGTYQVKVLADDGNGGKSGWSKSLAVKIS